MVTVANSSCGAEKKGNTFYSFFAGVNEKGGKQ